MTNRRIYKFAQSLLIIEFGDITKSQAQAIVSSDDYYLTMGGGVSRSILRAGGNAIALDAAKKVPASLADVVVTTAGDLPAHYIFHAITIGPNDDHISQTEVIRRTTQKCLELLNTLKLKSIAFPTIGGGAAGFNLEEVAMEMAEVIADDLLKREREIEVTIYLFDRFGSKTPIDYVKFFEEFASRSSRIAKHSIQETSLLPEEISILATDISKTAEEIKYQRLNNVRKLLASLEDQRYKIEEKLLDVLSDPEKKTEIEIIRQNLHENEELRLSYYGELKVLSAKDVPNIQKNRPEQIHKTIFVSSTFKDLVEYRALVKDQIARRDMLFRGMEHSGASPLNLPPAKKVIAEIRNADFYLGIFGVRYGSIDQATGLSITELEFNEAEASGKPMLLYIMHDDAPVKVADIETDAEGKIKLDKLKNRIQENYTVYKFSSKEDLARQVFEDLGKLNIFKDSNCP